MIGKPLALLFVVSLFVVNVDCLAEGEGWKKPLLPDERTASDGGVCSYKQLFEGWIMVPIHRLQLFSDSIPEAAFALGARYLEGAGLEQSRHITTWTPTHKNG